MYLSGSLNCVFTNNGNYSMMLATSRQSSFVICLLTVAVGNIDGYLKGRRYFQCPPNHGVMVNASNIICVTGRKVSINMHGTVCTL